MKAHLSVCFLVALTTFIQAQNPPIGIINFYGLRSVSEQQARTSLQIKEGEDAGDSKIEAARIRLEALPAIEKARVYAICCVESKAIIYVGIMEKGFPGLRFRPAPTGTVRLPDEVIKAGEDFSIAHRNAIREGDVGEDTSSGHSLMKNPEGRMAQEKFISIAQKKLKLLRSVLYQSSDAKHRALAAEILAYSKDKKSIVPDLVYAMSDSDELVRNNSMRALGLIAELAQNKPEKKIVVPYAPFIELLNSIEWTDRNKSSLALLRLTENRNKKLLAELRRKAFPSLVEMARWTHPGHAFAPFIVLARVGKIPDADIQKALETNSRETLIENVWKDKN